MQYLCISASYLIEPDLFQFVRIDQWKDFLSNQAERPAAFLRSDCLASLACSAFRNEL